jgi:hypothetical protein
MTKKWDDPQLDAAQFAIDRFWNAKQTVSEQMAEIIGPSAMEPPGTRTGRD